VTAFKKKSARESKDFRINSTPNLKARRAATGVVAAGFPFRRHLVSGERIMRTLSGAIMILAGAVLCAGGVIAHAIADAANKFTAAGDLAAVGGIVLGLIGLIVMTAGARADWHGRP
jgi:hypothetical protein